MYALLKRRLRRSVARQQLEAERQLDALTTTVKALEARVAELTRLQAGRMRAGETAGAERVEPQILAVITAAATAFLGKNVRVRSARLAPAADDDANPWSQQGRVMVHTSHNLRARE
jgi:hypothetical protein